jgi:tetratricopeptide (TPR) repeat protein
MFGPAPALGRRRSLHERRPRVSNTRARPAAGKTGHPCCLGFSPVVLFAVVALAAAGCASAPPSVPRRDRFPLDPREELTGPFSQETIRGCAALAEGEAAEAEAAFRQARSAAGGRRLAAEIGWIEAEVLEGRAQETLSSCDTLLAAGDPTVPLLVACGEARTLAEDTVAGYALYRRALARTSNRPGLAERAEELRLRARDELLARAHASAAKSEWARSRSAIGEAIALAPESSAVRIAAGDVEARAGDKPAALRRYREAAEIDPRNPVVLEKAGTLALELGDYELAVSAFERLARNEPRFAARAAQARLAFRVANWPPAEREAARSARLTRSGAADLVWWMVPEVREARVSAGVIASDAVSRRDSRALTRAVALGLLEVDPETHRVSPDAHLSLPGASKLLVRLLGVLKPSPDGVACLKELPRGPLSNAEAVRLAEGCGLFPEREGTQVSGPNFLQALDRARSLVSEGAR